MSDWDYPGKSIGRYTILGKLGAGGMAEVFLARSKGAGGIDKTLVLKKIHPILAKNRRFIDMFMEEARVAMRLNHSNIVQVYAFEQIEDDFVLAMEHVDGSDLLDIQTMAFKEGQRIPFGLCAFITAEIAKGLDYAHSRRDDAGEAMELVHRDVSPQNVLISKDGAVKVTDFGIVKARSVEEEAGEVKGKLGYMSPQQAHGLPVDRRADIFSLGVVLHEMLVGATRPAPKLGDVVQLDPPVNDDPSVPSRLNDITMKALAARPEDRFQTAREMVIELNSYLREEPDIYDATTLEEWIAATIPAEQLTKVRVENDLASLSEAKTNIYRDQTMMLRGIGEFEHQAVVLVSVRLQVDSAELWQTLEREFNRLAEEIAYKSGAICQVNDNVTRLFLGLPRSHFEDSISAVRLAHDLLDVVRAMARDYKIDIKAQIAVNLGDVKVGKAATEQPVVFEATNELVDTSSLLLNACIPDSILAGIGVYQIARTDFHFSEPVAIASRYDAVGGDSIDIFGYPVHGAKSRQERSLSLREDDVRFVGRKHELARLKEAFAFSMKKKPVVLKLTGELGLGKSILLRQFAELVAGLDTQVVRAECLFAERDTPIAAAVAVIGELLSLEDNPKPTEVHDALANLIGGAPHYLERQQQFFAKLLSSPEAVWDSYGHNRRELIRKTAFGLGVLLSQRASQKGLVLIVDNAQWLDGPSVDVLSELSQNILPVSVFVVLAGQPHTLEYRRIENLMMMELSELSNEYMQELIVSKIGNSKDVQEISSQILERAHGNPFFATEIIDSMIQRGIIKQLGVSKKGHPIFVQTRPGVIHLPTTVKGIADSRINSLSSSVRTVLRTASVIGVAFTAEELLQLTGKDVQPELDELTKKGFLVATGDGSDTAEYNFLRSIEREAAYDGLSQGDRRQLHQKLARKLMREVDTGKSIPPVRIAWHLDKSGQASLAAQYYLEAGDAAMNVYSSRRALRLFDRALALIPLGERERYDVLMRKERVIRDIGLHDIHLETIREMEDLGNRFEDTLMRAKAAYRHSRYEYSEGNFKASARKLEEAIRLVDKTSDTMLKVDVLRALVYLAIEEGELKSAMVCCDWALRMVDDSDDAFFLKARVLGLKGLVLMEMGQINEAAWPLVYAMISFRKLGDRRNESVQLANLALLAQARGYLIESLGFFEHALQLDREIRDVSQRGRKSVGCANVRVELGQFEKGEALLEEALRICRENAEPVGELEAKLGLAELMTQRGEPQAAKELLLEVKGSRFLYDSAISRVRHNRMLCEACIESGDTKTAVTAGLKMHRTATETGMRAEEVHSVAFYSLALAISGDLVSAEKVAAAFPELIDGIGLVRHAEKAWWLYARTLTALGKHIDANNALERAHGEVMRKIGYFDNQKHVSQYRNHPLIQSILNKKLP
ncbi:MAG: protein kinase [Deltaproteobacteria bacterium]|nr:protein kinase [Deltaproteobacteria bacterium]